MDAAALAVVVKAARKEAAKATDAAVKAVSNKFGKAIAEFGDRLDKSEKSAKARIDKVDSKHRKTLGELADEQKRIKESLGSTNKTITELADDVSNKTKELLKSVRELPVPEDGKDANQWHLTKGQPDPELGDDDDFALDGNSSDIWHKEDGEWEFVMHLKAEMPMFQPPRAYSPDQIAKLADPKKRVIVVSDDHNFDPEMHDVVKVRGEAIITIPAPTQNNKGCQIEVKIQTDERVEIKPQGGLIEDEVCRFIENRKYWNFRLLSDGIEWTEQ